MVVTSSFQELAKRQLHASYYVDKHFFLSKSSSQCSQVDGHDIAPELLAIPTVTGL